MSKKVSFLVICIFSLSLVFVSCKNKKKEDEDKTQTEQTLNGEKDSAMESDTKSTENLITQNEDKYPRDIKVFDNKDFSKRFKDLVGDSYDSILDNFDTQTPIVSDQGVYKFSGCKEHDCPSFHTIVLYDSADDNLNVLIEKNGKTKVYDENGKIEISEALKAK